MISIFAKIKNPQTKEEIEAKGYSGSTSASIPSLGTVYYVNISAKTTQRVKSIEILESTNIIPSTISFSVENEEIKIRGYSYNIMALATIKMNVYYSDDIYELSNKNLVSIDSSIFSVSDSKLPRFGLFSNNGMIEFVDSDGYILQLFENGVFEKNAKCLVYIVNDITGAKEQIGEYFAVRWGYDQDQKVCSVELADGLQELQNIYNNGFAIRGEMTMIDVYNFLVSSTEGFYFSELDEKTKNVLQKTVCSFPYMERATLWSQWQKLCDVCGLYVYKNKLGEITISYFGG